MQATNEIPHVTPEEAREMAASGRAVLIDVREPEELAVAAIAGAVNVPLSSFSTDDVLSAAGDREIIFFCKIGGRAMNACQYFSQQSGRAASCMTGSITGWAAKGLPLVSGS